MKPLTIVLGISLLLVGCNEDRIVKLEKQNQELQTQVKEIKKRDVVAEYDLQAKCAHDSKVWFNENWQSDRDTLLLTYTDHYSRSQNKCFLFVEYHHAYTKDWWVNAMSIWDIYENVQYGEVNVNHYTEWKPRFSSREEVNSCAVAGKKCSTVEEFNSLVRPYLGE